MEGKENIRVSEKKTYDKWTDEEVNALLAFYATEEVQRGFESSRRNEKVFLDISAHLDGLGIHHTAKQCREKIKKLKQDYKRLKDHNNRSGSDRKTNKWFDRLDGILGHRPSFTSDPGTKDSTPSTSAQMGDCVERSYSDPLEEQSSLLESPQEAPVACSTPRGFRASAKRKRQTTDLDILREMEEESRKEAREEHEALFRMLAEQEERSAAARERATREAEAARLQLCTFQGGLLALLGAVLSRSQPSDDLPLD